MSQLSNQRVTASWRRILVAGLLIGALDLLFAIGFWNLRGVPAVSILQSIATGWYGTDAFALGSRSAWIGFASHFAIAVVIAACCALLLSRWRIAGRAWIPAGLAYGVGVFAVMNFIVPMVSRASPASFADLGWTAANIGMHLAIGLACVRLLLPRAGRAADPSTGTPTRAQRSPPIAP